jgi:hypothetical protein
LQQDALVRRLGAISLINKQLAETGAAHRFFAISAVLEMVNADTEMGLIRDHREVYRAETVIHQRGLCWMIGAAGGLDVLVSQHSL